MTVAFYLSRQVATRIAAVLTGLLTLGLSLDMLENAEKILDRDGIVRLGEYAVLRAPLILITVLPLGVLVGAALAFLSLAVRNEMVVLRAAGYNTVRILLLLLPLAALCGVLQSQMAARVGPAAEQALAQRFPALFEAAAIEREVWLRDGHAVVRISRADADGVALGGISIFETDLDGALIQRIDAVQAWFTLDGWTLKQVTIERRNEAVRQVPEMAWDTRLTPAGILGVAHRSELVDSDEVREILSGALPGGRGTSFYSVQLWRSYAAYVVPLVMIVFGAMASFGLSRSGGGIGRVALGLLLGAGFVLVDGVLSSLGEAGAMHATVAAFLAPGLFFVIGLWSIVVIEE